MKHKISHKGICENISEYVACLVDKIIRYRYHVILFAVQQQLLKNRGVRQKINIYYYILTTGTDDHRPAASGDYLIFYYNIDSYYNIIYIYNKKKTCSSP